MKMCLAPCFAGCSPEEYANETTRVVEFLSTSGGSLQAELGREREAASEATDFEKAATVHKRLDKVSEVLRGLPELARPIEQLDAVIMQRAAEPETIAVFIVRCARIEEPFLLRFGQTAEPRSAEEILRQRLSEPAAADPGEPPADHLSMIAKWFYSKPRAGEIFYREKDWPLRRMVRACARLLAAGASAPRREPGGSTRKSAAVPKPTGPATKREGKPAKPSS
jgi:hypothetical protein